ncbi:hypothetical protein NCS52_00169900 [Fusarium sp. LHS14.1]|nr:hypothetical protein NCS52_00169900 [Fusarium sp. LHS14.1]
MYRSAISSAPLQSRVDAGGTRDKFIAIGIDFGTTFSGVSWAFSEQPDTIHEISEWPAENHMNQQEVQVPTVYDIASGKWGYQVTPDMKPVRWFKLLLLSDDDLAKEENQEVSRSKQLREARDQLSNNPGKITAVDLVGQYLKNLWDHTYKTLKTMVDIDSIPLCVAITIPAIWPHYAQNAMREAAKIAGITKRRTIGTPTLGLVQEPEAASLSIMQERGLLAEIKPGECFVVCDAGGGTVDVISYMVVSNDPFRLKECVKGEGGLCGAVRIDEAFEAHLMGKNRLKLDRLNVSEYNTLVVDGWERGVKRTFTDAESPAEFSLRLPYKAFKTQDRWRNRDNFSLNRSEVRGFFSKSLTGIRTLVSNQREQVKKETGKNPRNVLLVGGLGSSLHIHGFLNSLFNGTVLRPRNGWSAVARGAVIRLLHDKLSSQPNLPPPQRRVLATLPNVTARKSRYSYGIEVDTHIAHLDDYDRTLDKTSRDPAGDEVTTRMRWYLRRGEEVSGRSPVTFSYSRYYQEPVPKTCQLDIQCSSAELPPKRADSTVEYLCTIECEFDTGFSQWEPVGNIFDGFRRCDNLELKMTFTGEPSWNFQVGAQQATTTNARVSCMD